MEISLATRTDYEYLKQRDIHVEKSLLAGKITNGEIYILRTDDSDLSTEGENPRTAHERLRPDSGNRIGWLRYGYFWDNTPFLNLIWLDEPYRGKGLGRQAMLHWEREMGGRGFSLVMTSTLANEQAQHFYRRLGYKDAGCLLLEDEPLEILLTKRLGDST